VKTAEQRVECAGREHASPRERPSSERRWRTNRAFRRSSEPDPNPSCVRCVLAQRLNATRQMGAPGRSEAAFAPCTPVPFFIDLNREHFGGAGPGRRPFVTCGWVTARMRRTAGSTPPVAGRWQRSRAKIVLSRPLREALPQTGHARPPLCQSMIHAWIDLVLG